MAQSPGTATLRAMSPHLRIVPLDDSGPVDPHAGPKPWERRPGESENSYAYYRAYEGLGYPEGELGPVQPRSRTELERRCNLSPGALRQHAATYEWDMRVGAWDREVDRRKRAATLDTVKLVKENQIRIAHKFRNLGEAELDKWLAKSASTTETVLTVKEALAVGDFGMKLERALQEASTAQDLAGDKGIDLAKLEIEDLEKMHGILKKAGQR